MPAVKETTNQFYQSVKNEFVKLSSVKEGGVAVYSQDYVLLRVAKKFYRSPRTIENIVFDRA